MKLIIDIPEEIYNDCKVWVNDRGIATWQDKVIADGIPYEERPQGRWIQTEVIDDDSEYGVNADASECSNCKHIESSHYWTTTYYNFCPNCGANMQKGGVE